MEKKKSVLDTMIKSQASIFLVNIYVSSSVIPSNSDNQHSVCAISCVMISVLNWYRSFGSFIKRIFELLVRENKWYFKTKTVCILGIPRTEIKPGYNIGIQWILVKDQINEKQLSQTAWGQPGVVT